jgi:hypothetical protein
MPSSGWICWEYVAVDGYLRLLAAAVVAATVAVRDISRPRFWGGGVELGLPSPEDEVRGGTTATDR